MEFKVKGTSFNNEDGKSRQKIIQEVLKTYLENDYIEKEEFYGGNTNKEIEEYDLYVSKYEDIPFSAKLKKDKYKNEDCIAVYLLDYNNNEFQIGNVPKELVKEVMTYIKEQELNVTANILGKEYKKYDFDEDKVIIEKVDSYGISINLPKKEKTLIINELEKEENNIDNIDNKSEEVKCTKKYNQDILFELVICILLGMFGVHKFYKGKIKEGLLYLFTGGIFGIGWIVDIIKLAIALQF